MSQDISRTYLFCYLITNWSLVRAFNVTKHTILLVTRKKLSLFFRVINVLEYNNYLYSFLSTMSWQLFLSTMSWQLLQIGHKLFFLLLYDLWFSQCQNKNHQI